MDQVDHDRVRGAAGADCGNGVLPAYAYPRRIAWPAGLGGVADAAVRGRMIVAASTTLLADSRTGRRGGVLPWALLVAGSVARLAANAAVAEPTMVGRMIAAWPSFALTASYQLLTRQVRASAAHADDTRVRQASARPHALPRAPRAGDQAPVRGLALVQQRPAKQIMGSELQRRAWQSALANRASDGTLPSGKQIADRYGRHERWGETCQTRRYGQAS